MKFGIEKCPMLGIEKGNIVRSAGMEWPDGKVTAGYKYLGILEAEKFFRDKMKQEVSRSNLEGKKKL